jgi:hypothetical protein
MVAHSLTRDTEQHRGPSLTAVAGVFVALFAASLIASAALTGTHFPSPFEPAAAAAYFSDHPDAVRWCAFLQFGAAIPLAIFSATASSRLRFLGVQVAGPSIALLGGVLASGMAALSGLLEWVLAQPGIGATAGVVRALHLLSFATGGPGFVVPFGILVAGISVSGGLTRNLPRWLMWFGLFVAIVAELSSLAIVLQGAAYLLPVARFSGFIWLIAAGVTLPSRRNVSA